jgi:hypothetical protein
MIDWEWIKEGIVLFMKTVVALSFVSLVSIVLFEIMLRIRGRSDVMKKRIYFVVGNDSDSVWNTSITSNNINMGEEDALFEFKRLFGEDGVIIDVVELDDDGE